MHPYRPYIFCPPSICDTDSSLKNVLKKEDIGQIDVYKKNSSPKLFLWLPSLDPDPCHMMVSQWKQALAMMPVIGLMPPPGDSKYSPKDSLCKEVHVASSDQGYHTSKPSANEDDTHMYINARNEIRMPYLNFVRVCILKISRDTVTNSRDHLTHSKKFDLQSEQLTRHLSSVQCDLATWLQRHVPALYQDLFREKSPPIETDLKKICQKIIHFENKIRNDGVRTGWNGRKEKAGVWVGQWFLYTMVSDRHRMTVDEFPSWASLQDGQLPEVIASDSNPPLDKFVQHVHDSGYDEGEILHPLRHNALHWMGKPISDDTKKDVHDPFA